MLLEAPDYYKGRYWPDMLNKFAVHTPELLSLNFNARGLYYYSILP